MTETNKPYHPGILVKAIIDDLDLSINAFAKELKVSPATIHRVVTGKSAISPEMALRLAATIGISAKLWMQRQAEYDLFNAQKQVDVSRLPQLRS